MKAVLDLDGIKYTAASAGEKRTVRVIHKSSNKEIECKTRTEFYGHWKKKDGGILAEINKKSRKEFTPEDFEYIDVQTPEPIENVLHTAKLMTETWIKSVKADSHIGFIGKGDSFRVERSTILKYKGNRTNLIRPVYLDAVSDYLVKKFNVEVINGLEADDACIIEAYRDRNSVVVSYDKDAKGCHVLVYNPNKPEKGIVDCGKFGELYLNDKKEVDGYGRMFFYLQVLSGDSSDNYSANSASDVSWGDKSAYAQLKDAKTDKEAFAALVSGYKHLYPEPKIVEGWRGDQIEIDWKYVLHENWDLARMLRWEGDVVNPFDVMKKLGVDYE